MVAPSQAYSYVTRLCVLSNQAVFMAVCMSWVHMIVFYNRFVKKNTWHLFLVFSKNSPYQTITLLNNCGILFIFMAFI